MSVQYNPAHCLFSFYRVDSPVCLHTERNSYTNINSAGAKTFVFVFSRKFSFICAKMCKTITIFTFRENTHVTQYLRK